VHRDVIFYCMIINFISMISFGGVISATCTHLFLSTTLFLFIAFLCCALPRSTSSLLLSRFYLFFHAPPHRRPVLGRSLSSEPFLHVSLVSDQNEVVHVVSRACIACDLWLDAGCPDATDALRLSGAQQPQARRLGRVCALSSGPSFADAACNSHRRSSPVDAYVLSSPYIAD